MRPEGLERYMRDAVKVSNDSPVLLDRYLNDAIGSGRRRARGTAPTWYSAASCGAYRGRPGCIPGDSACSLPPYSLSNAFAGRAARRQTVAMAKALNVVGLMNVPFAVKSGRRQGRRLRARSQPVRREPCPLRVEGRRSPAGQRSQRAAWPNQTLEARGIVGEALPPYFR